jgi:hypothetical protein
MTTLTAPSARGGPPPTRDPQRGRRQTHPRRSAPGGESALVYIFTLVPMLAW